jgi:hypothetical protein
MWQKRTVVLFDSGDVSEIIQRLAAFLPPKAQFDQKKRVGATFAPQMRRGLQIHGVICPILRAMPPIPPNYS